MNNEIENIIESIIGNKMPVLLNIIPDQNKEIKEENNKLDSKEIINIEEISYFKNKEIIKVEKNEKEMKENKISKEIDNDIIKKNKIQNLIKKKSAIKIYFNKWKNILDLEEKEIIENGVKKTVLSKKKLIYKSRAEEIMKKKNLEEKEKQELIKEREILDKEIDNYNDQYWKLKEDELKKNKEEQDILKYQMQQKINLKNREKQEEMYQKRMAEY